MITEKTLPNGIELIVKTSNVPVVAVQVWVDVGSIDERPIEAGYCHFLEHMLFKGTKKRSTAQIAGTVEGSGGDMNAFTSYEHTVYHITASNQQWKMANSILEDMVMHSVFKPAEFNPEKEVILEEIRRGYDSPDRALYENLMTKMYGNTGYGRSVIGFPKTVKKCTAVGLKKFWEKWYTPSLMTVIVVGDIDFDEVEKEILKTWGKNKNKFVRNRRRDIGFNSKLQSPKNLRVEEGFDLHSIKYSAAMHATGMRDPKLPALDVAAMIFGSGESSRLYQRLFQDEQIVTAINASMWAPIGTGLFAFDVESSLENSGKFRPLLLEEIERFIKDGPTSNELDRTKVQIESDRIYGSQSMEDIASRLGHLKLAVGNTTFDLEYMTQVKELTQEDVKKAFAELYLTRPVFESLLTPKDYDSKLFWDNKKISSASKIVQIKKSSQSIEGEHHKLSNGIELCLFPRSDLPVVSLQSCIMGGLRAENRKNAGIGNVLSEIWGKGPKEWSSTKFAEFLESRASKIDTFSGRNSIGVTATTLTKYFDDIFPLYIETMFNPALSEEEFDHAKELVLEDIKTLEDNPGRLVGKQFVETLFEGHPYGIPMTGYEDSVKSLNIEAVRAHYQKQMGAPKVVVSVCGKFQRDQVIEKFSKIQRKINKSTPDTIEMFQPKSERIVEVVKNREQSHIIYGFIGTRALDQRRYALKMLLTIMGGQSGRLFREIRDKQGLCYTVSPMCMEGVEPGYFAIYIGCDPAKREQALKSIRIELDKLSSKSVPSGEFKRAQEFILGRHHMDNQLTSSIAAVTAFNTLYGLQYNEHETWEHEIRKVKPKDVQSLAKDLFNQSSVTSVVI